MAKLSHRFEYLFALVIQTIACLLSEKTADVFGRYLGRMVCFFWGSRRKIAFDNLKSTIGKNLSDSEIDKTVRLVFENIGQTFIEVARFKLITPSRAREIVSTGWEDSLRKIQGEGKGGILFTAHYGNWELLGHFLHAEGFKTDYLVVTQHNVLFDELLEKARKSVDVEIIHTDKSMRGIYRSFEKNKFVAIASDQHDPSKSLIMDFLGKPAAVAKGAAVLALRIGVPLIPILTRRVRYDQFELITDEPIYPPDGGVTDENIKFIMNKYHEFLEKQIRLYPGQWLWTHRRWKIKEQ